MSGWGSEDRPLKSPQNRAGSEHFHIATQRPGFVDQSQLRSYQFSYIQDFESPFAAGQHLNRQCYLYIIDLISFYKVALGGSLGRKRKQTQGRPH